MLKNRSLRFFAEDDGGGGGTAIADTKKFISEGFKMAFPGEDTPPPGSEPGAVEIPPTPPTPTPEPPAPPKKEAPPPPPADAARDLASDFLGLTKTPPPAEPAKQEFSEEPPPEIKSPKARENWKNLQGIAKAATEEAARLKAEIQSRPEAKDVQAKEARIQELETQINQMGAYLERASLESHPAFQQQFAVPRQNLMAQAKETLESVEVDPAGFSRALALTGKERIQALDALLEGVESKFARTALERIAASIDEIDRGREAALKDAAYHNEQLRRQDTLNQHQQLQQQEKTLRAHFQAAHDSLVEQGFELLKEFPDDDNMKPWNEQRRQIVNVAEKIMFDTTDPRQISTAALLAASAGPLRAMLHATRKKVAELERKLKARTEESEPPLGGGAGGETTTTTPAGPDEDFEKSAAKGWPLLGK